MVSKSASREPPPSAAPGTDTVLVGRVIRPHGVRGELRVEVWSDVPARFEPGSELLLMTRERPEGTPETVRIDASRPVRGGRLIRLAGYESRDQAERVRGARLAVERDRVPAAPVGSYYHFELVGCRCFDSHHGDLGRVAELVEDGGGFLLEVIRGERRLLVPFVAPFLERVDVVSGRIDLRLPPGLVEACASGS